MYNQTLITTIEDRLNKVQEHLFLDFNNTEDLYVVIAEIMYHTDIHNLPNSKVTELRERVKQFLIPVIIECGGITEEE